MVTLLDNIQSERRDCIVWCPDLQIGIRANAEETTKMIDIAGNTYDAGIPVPENAPSTALGGAAAGRLANGYYGYVYVFAAKNRYPLLSAGKAHGGSIAPRGNPSPVDIIQVTGGPRRVEVTVEGSDRLDIDQIIIYRTNVWASLEEAQLAADAGQMFVLAVLDNTLPDQVYNDDNPLVSNTEIVEYDNQFAPTMMLLTYEAPFVWGIGNDVLIKFVNWEGNVVNLQDEGKWFEGRNGMLCTITGINSGGIDGRGTFLFKAGDLSGNNLNTSAVLTIDGETPETLTPSTGEGYIRIAGPATTLFRSKPFNPLSWGETIIQGQTRFGQLFARRISSGRATAIGIVPGGEYLKVDCKDPSICYTFSLRAAGTPAFEASRREISRMSVSHHFSQFVAMGTNGQKVLWGWDADNHAILECDGNSQRIISHNVFETLNLMQTTTRRAQYSQGVCNEELEYNIMFLPFGADINATDLAVYQHYPSQTWGTAFVGDLLATCTIRDPLTNLLRFLAGRDSGYLVEHQREDLHKNHFASTFTVHSYPTDDMMAIYLDISGFVPEIAGGWAVTYSNLDRRIKFGRIANVNLEIDVNLTIVTFDKIIEVMDGGLTYSDNIQLVGSFLDVKLHVGCIPVVLEKVLELGTSTELKKFQSFSVSGIITPQFIGDANQYGTIRLYTYSPDFTNIERLPVSPPGASGQNAVDTVFANQGNFVFSAVEGAEHGKLSLRLAVVYFDLLQLRTLNLDLVG